MSRAICRTAITSDQKPARESAVKLVMKPAMAWVASRIRALVLTVIPTATRTATRTMVRTKVRTKVRAANRTAIGILDLRLPSVFCLLLAASLLLVPAGAAHAQDTPAKDLAPEARMALSKAQALLDNGQALEAARAVREYLALADSPDAQQTDGGQADPAPPVPPEAYQLLGVALHDAGDLDGALDAFLQGVERFPEDALLAKNSAVLLYQADRNAEAAPLFEQAYDLSRSQFLPLDPELLYRAGSAWYLAEDYAASARVLGRLMDSAPVPKPDWARLAVYAFLAAGNTARAESMALALVRTAPGDALAWELLAQVNLDRERYARAAAALEVCYRLREPGVRELEQLADLYRYVQAPLRAVQILERAHAGRPDPELAARLAELYAASGRTGQALALLERSAQSPAGLLIQARILFQARGFQEAELVLKECLSTAPGSAEAHFYRGLVAWEARDWALARSEFGRVTGSKEYGSRASAALTALDALEQARLESRPN